MPDLLFPSTTSDMASDESPVIDDYLARASSSSVVCLQNEQRRPSFGYGGSRSGSDDGGFLSPAELASEDDSEFGSSSGRRGGMQPPYQGTSRSPEGPRGGAPSTASDSEQVTVCYFDKDAYSTSELRDFRAEEAAARREVQQMYAAASSSTSTSLPSAGAIPIPSRDNSHFGGGSSAGQYSTSGPQVRQTGPREQIGGSSSSGGFRDYQGETKHQRGSAATWFVPPQQVSIQHDQFLFPDLAEDSGASSTSSSAFGAADPRSAAALHEIKGTKLTTDLTFRCDDLSLAIYGGTDFAMDSRAKLQTLTQPAAANRLNRRRKDLSLVLQLKKALARMMVPVGSQKSTGGEGDAHARNTYRSSGVVGDSLPCDVLQRRLVVSVHDLLLRDEVQTSAFQHVLSYYHDEKNRPRGSDLDMLVVRLDEYASAASPLTSSQQSRELSLDVKLLPLRFTIDQDVVDFAFRFVRLTTLPRYIEMSEEEEGDLVNIREESDPLFGASATAAATSSQSHVAGTIGGDRDRTRHSSSSTSSASSTPGATRFQHVRVSALLAVMDYRAKRLDVQALQRGDLSELINLLPLLEGLEIAFRSVRLSNVPASRLGLLLAEKWSRDLNRSQILRSLSGITPIRSFANIGSALTEFVREPLQLALAEQFGGLVPRGRANRNNTLSRFEQQHHLSRLLVRGATGFLRNLTIESLELTEKAFFATQSVLEFAEKSIGDSSNSRGSDAASRRTAAQRARQQRAAALRARAPVRGARYAREDDDGMMENSDDPYAPLMEDEEWLSVDKGAREGMQPADGIEGLQMGLESLKRNMVDAGRVLSDPLASRGAESAEDRVKQLARGVPICILKPAIGVSGLAATTLRGVRNSMDHDRREELERKYKAPG
ncbi:unnamed protein product [Amoebophrya sp. A25]|nr:unnamed protein product [Amoebophrya sp. A25]|eukprot:GSA25T00003842001.1